MRKTYIATTQEAKALFDGTQTAIITKMDKQPPSYGCRIQHGSVIYEDQHGGVHSRKSIPYAIGQEVVVREAWIKLTPNHIIDSQFVYKSQMCQESEEIRQEYISIGYPYTWNSPATMPVSAARTRFIPVSCEAVRVRDDIGYSNAVSLLEFDYSEGQQFKNYDKDWSRYDNTQFQFGDYRDSWKSYITHKLGQSAWDNNDYVFYYKVQKI